MTYRQRPWTKFYDEGVPVTLEPYPQQPFYQFLRDAAQHTPDNIAAVMSAHLPVIGRQKASITYRQMDAQSDALAVALVEMGVQKGDRVVLILPNCTQFVLVFHAALKAGAVVSAMNPTYPPPKMLHQLQDCGATTVITLSLFYKTLKSIQKNTAVKNIIVTNIKDYLPTMAAVLFTAFREEKEGHRIQKAPEDHWLLDLLKRYEGRNPSVEVHPGDPALFQYTGGTTGVPKAAVATHRALVANTLQCRSFLGKMGTEVFLAAIPMFHVFGMISVMGMAVSLAASMLMIANPRETDEILDVIHAYKPTFFMGVPAMYNAINNHPDVMAGKYDLHSIRVCVSGSAPLPPSTKRTFESLTGAKLVEGYGMSETPTALSVNPLYGDNRVGSIGLPLPDVDIRIVSLEDGETDLSVGEAGELLVRGPQLMTGYHNMPAETENVLRAGPDGKLWLHTGDIARMDNDGYVYIVDRKKDMALIGGYNVYPTNVENVLLEHPCVQEVGVATVPHPEKEGQECLKAWVVRKPQQSCTDQELIDFAAQRLARYEVPTRIAFVTELPKTTVGKVLRRELVLMDKNQRSAEVRHEPA